MVLSTPTARTIVTFSFSNVNSLGFPLFTCLVVCCGLGLSFGEMYKSEYTHFCKGLLLSV